MKPRTRAQDRALNRGEPFHLFPMPLRGAAGGLVAGALVRRGLATDEPAPVLTALGIREARTILTRAFANEVVNSILWEPLRDRLGELVLARLEQLGGGE